MENFQYAAFISYRHKSPDDAIAKRLHKLIETYAVPGEIKKRTGRAKMGRVFRDQEELPLSVDLGADIKTALDNSQWLIVICSPDYLQSRWCMTEIDYFISLGRRDHILALLANGEPADSFPEQICRLDAEKAPVEPLAADVRAKSVSASLKKLGREKLRIIAPMLGVSFDTLRQRARRRRIRTAAAVTAAVIAMLAGFLAYSLVKNDEIAKQRDEASYQRDEAARQRDTALDNHMQTLIGQSNASVGTGNKAPAKKYLAEAGKIRESVGDGNDEAYYSALESALYTQGFDVVQTVNNDNRKLSGVVFSHDDRYLLGITNLNSAALIDAENGEFLFTVSRSDFGKLDSVGFTKDDKYFYTVDSWYGYVSLYKTETGELYRQFDANDGTAQNVGGAVFALEGGRIVVPTRRGLCIWDYEADTGEDVLSSEYSSSDFTPFSAVDISPDGTSAVIGSTGYGSGLKIISLDGKKEIKLENDSKRGFFPISYSGDGRFVAASSMSLYFVWNAEDGKLVQSGEKNGDSLVIAPVKLNYDGSVLIVTGSNYLGAVEVSTGKLLWEKSSEEGSNVVTDAVISPNGKYVASVGGISGVYDIRTGEILTNRPCSAFSNDGRTVLCDEYLSTPSLLVTPEYATAKIVESYNGTLFRTPRYTDPPKSVGLVGNHNPGEYYTTSPGNANRKTAVYIDPETKYAVYTHPDGFMEIYDITDADDAREIYCVAEHCYNSIEDVVFSGDLMASSGGFDPRCAVFDLYSGTMVHVLKGDGYVYKSEFSKDGEKIILLSGRGQKIALVYSVRTGNLLYRIDAPDGETVTDVGFDEENNSAVALFSDGRAAVCEMYGTLDEMITKASE